MSKASHSLIISVFNLSNTVKTVYQDLTKAMGRLPGSYDIVFVDDASTDNTYEQLVELAQTDSNLRVIKMRTSFGEAAALDAGLRHSTGERIVFISGRVRVNVAQIPDLVNALDLGNDLVIGRRYPRRDALMNRWISGLFNWIVSRICKVRLRDMNSGVFASTRAVFDKIAVYGDLNNFIAVLASQQGYQLAEVDIEQLSGTFRMSRYPKEYVSRLLDIITVFFLTRYSKKPIHFMGFMGALFFLIGLGIEIYLFIYRILQLGPIAGRPLIILGALLLVIGIQLISIGLLGEMIIFTHAGDIEEYNIETILNEDS
ncbi:glycosyltransferase [candidate division KSB1 bacterium]|nr:glycosyltransferase [candidate division KSB1 bacterium]